MGEIVIKNSDSHPTPSSGNTSIYPKTNKTWYYKDDNGNEYPITRIVTDSTLSGEGTVTSPLTVAQFKRSGSIQFCLTENISVSNKFYFTGRSDGGVGGVRSCADNGFFNSDDCSGFVIPYNAIITSARVKIWRSGVNAGSVASTVYLRNDLFRVNLSSKTKIADLDFPINTATNTVGTYNLGSTDATISINTAINVNTGDMIGAQFLAFQTTDQIGLLLGSTITLNYEEII